MNKKFGAISSSQNPDQIASTVKGLVLSFSSIIILIAQQFFNLTLTATDIASLSLEAGAIAGAVMTLYGLVLKVLAWKFRTE